MRLKITIGVLLLAVVAVAGLSPKAAHGADLVSELGSISDILKNLSKILGDILNFTKTPGLNLAAISGSLSDGLAGYWSFEEGQGVTAADSSGSGNSARLVNGPAWAEGKIGNALNFNNSRLDIEEQASFNFEKTNSFSVSAWIKTTNEGAQTIVAKNDAASPNSGWIMRLNGGVAEVLLINSNVAPVNRIYVKGVATIAEGIWNHVAMTYDGSGAASGVRIFLNGIESGSYVIAGDSLTGSIQNSANVTVGGLSSNTWPFKGSIDEVYVYNRILSNSEIQELYRGSEASPAEVVSPSLLPASDTTPPTVSFVSPMSGSEVSGIVTVSVDASDNKEISGVQFKLDGDNLKSEATSTPYLIQWDSSAVMNGSHSLAATARDATGNILTVSIVVTVSNSAAASYSAGSASSNSMAPELPREYIDTVLPVLAGKIIEVSKGGDLQKALNSAEPGDTITLEAGASFLGPFTLPNKNGSDWIIVRTGAPDTLLPPAGSRINPSYSPAMAKIVAPGANVAIKTASGAGRYRFIGIEFKPAENSFVWTLIPLGSPNETSEANLPHHIVFDRTYIHGDALRGGRRGLEMDGKYIAVMDSYISDFKEQGADSQGVAAWNGPGPFKIKNNYIEAAGENIMFGGSPGKLPNVIASDIEIKNNHFYKPLRWRKGDPSYDGSAWTVKNLLEFKNGQRAVIEGNVFENNWAGSQTGKFLVLTPRGEGGAMPWATVQDIVFKNNIIRRSTNGINILGRDNTGASDNAKRIVIENNVFEIGEFPISGSGNFLSMTAGQNDSVRVEHNTVINAGNIISADLNVYGGSGGQAVPATNFVFRNNIVNSGMYPVHVSGIGGGTKGLNGSFSSYEFNKNVVIGPWPTAGGARAADYPGGNFYPQSVNGVGFADYANKNYKILSGSQLKNAATDGKDIGADIEAVESATAGAVGGSPVSSPDSEPASSSSSANISSDSTSAQSQPLPDGQPDQSQQSMSQSVDSSQVRNTGIDQPPRSSESQSSSTPVIPAIPDSLSDSNIGLTKVVPQEKILSRGMKGEEVKNLQKNLVMAGLLEADYQTGYFGKYTEDAVRKFQCREGILCGGRDWGIYNAETYAKLTEETAAQSENIGELIKNLQSKLIQLLTQLLKLLAVQKR